MSERKPNSKTQPENPEEEQRTGETTESTSQTGTAGDEQSQSSGDDRTCAGDSSMEEDLLEEDEEELTEDEEESTEDGDSVVEISEQERLKQDTVKLKQILIPSLTPDGTVKREQQQQVQDLMEVDDRQESTLDSEEQAKARKRDEAKQHLDQLRQMCGGAAVPLVQPAVKQRMDKIFGPFNAPSAGDQDQGPSGPADQAVTAQKKRSKDLEEQQIDEAFDFIKQAGDNLRLDDMAQAIQETLETGPYRKDKAKRPESRQFKPPRGGIGPRGRGGQSMRQPKREKTPEPRRQKSDDEVARNTQWCDFCKRLGNHTIDNCRDRGQMFKAGKAAGRKAAEEARQEFLRKLRERQEADAKKASDPQTPSKFSDFGGSQGGRKRTATDHAYSRQNSRDQPKRRQTPSASTQSDLAEQYAVGASNLDAVVEAEARARAPSSSTSTAPPEVTDSMREHVMHELLDRLARGDRDFLRSAPSELLGQLASRMYQQPGEVAKPPKPEPTQQTSTFGLSGPAITQQEWGTMSSGWSSPSRGRTSRDSSRSTRLGGTSQRRGGRGAKHQAETCRVQAQRKKDDDQPPPSPGAGGNGKTRGGGFLPKRRGSSQSGGSAGQTRSSASDGGKHKSVQQPAELTRQRALGFEATLDLSYRMPEDYRPSRYYIGKRVGDVAIGILYDPTPAMLTQHFPLFLQFGFKEQPEAAQGLVVGDIVMVDEFGLLVNLNGTKRVFQPGNSKPRGYFVDPQQKVIIPSCVALVFNKTGNSTLKQFRQVAVITLLERPSPSRNKFRWEAEFASLHFQKGGSAENAHILDGSHSNGFHNPPLEGHYVWINAYGKQKNQTLYIGDLVVPATWAKHAEPAENGECVLMWMERLSQDTKVILERNQGLGKGDHTPDSFRGDFEVIRMASTAASAGERQKYVHDMRRVKVPGLISALGDNRSYTFTPTWTNPSNRDVTASLRYLQPGAIGRLEWMRGHAWEPMFRIVTQALVAPDGRIRSIRFRRIVERWGRREEDRPEGVDHDGNPSVLQLGHDMADLMVRDEEDPAVPAQEEGELPEDGEEVVTMEEELEWLNSKWPNRAELRVSIDEQATGLEERITLLASCPLPNLAVEHELVGFRSMREELLCTLIPISDVKDSAELAGTSRDVPKTLGDCPKYHKPPLDWLGGEHGYAAAPTDQAGRREYLANCVPQFEAGRDIRDPARLDQWESLYADPTLNTEQKLATYASAYGLHPGIFVQAPAGSGKTRLLGEVTKHVRNSRPKEKILGVAVTNLAAMHLAEEICRANGIQDSDDKVVPSILAIQSTHSMIAEHARELGPRTNQALLNKIGIVAHVKELIRRRENNDLDAGTLTEAQLENCRHYVRNKTEHPGDLTDDDKMTRLILSRQADISIVVCTVAKAQQLTKLLVYFNLLMVDECQMVRMVDVQNLVWATGIEQLLVTGDVRQLPPFVQHDWAEFERYKFALHSVAEFFDRWLKNKTMSLKKVYRFHKDMVPVISYAFYDEKVEHGFGEENIRTMVETHHVPVISRKTPISLIHLTDAEEPAIGTSWSNPGQEQVAESILKMLRKRVPQASVTVVCFYTGTARRMEEAVARLLAAEPALPPEHRRLEVRTVHSYIGQEADFVILITTRTMSVGPPSGKEIREFVHEAKIATVAFTRAREAAFVIGNMDWLHEKFDQSSMDPDKEPMAAVGRYVNRTTVFSPPANGHLYQEYLDWLNEQPAEIPLVYSEPGQILLNPRRGNTAFMANTRPGKDLGWREGASVRGPRVFD